MLIYANIKREYMASLEQSKVHNQSRTYRMVVPSEWRKANRIENKDSLDIIVSHALVVLPPRILNGSEVEELVSDIRQIIKARDMLALVKPSK